MSFISFRLKENLVKTVSFTILVYLQKILILKIFTCKQISLKAHVHLNNLTLLKKHLLKINFIMLRQSKQNENLAKVCF